MSEIVSDCQFCGKPGHMYVNREKGVFFCFRCQTGGSVRRLEGDLGWRFSEGRLPDWVTGKLREAERGNAPHRFPLSDLASAFLTETRGINPSLVESLPIFSSDGGILFDFPGEDFWQLRRWAGKPRWLCPNGQPAASRGVVYHIGQVGLGLTGPGPVVIVEGILDALKVLTAGHDAAAILSSRLHDAQAERLGRVYNNAVLMLDADVTTPQIARALAVARAHFGQVRLVNLREGDPGEMGMGELREVLG